MFPIGDQIDPETPTDPNELVLYKKYGKNWRDVISNKRYSRDRGGNFDRGMRFMHTTPEGFMTRPTPPMSKDQMVQSDIDQSGYMSQMQKMQDDYNRMLQEWYSLTGSSAYQEQQDYYAGNYQDYYGSGSGSQDSQYSMQYSMSPPTTDVAAPAPAPAPVGITGGGLPAPALIPQNGPTGTTATQPNVILPRPEQTAAAYAQVAKNNAATSAPVAPTNDRGGDRILVSTAPTQMVRPAPAATAPTMSEQFIPRFDRDNQDGKINPAPVKTVTKPVTSYKKVKAF